MGGDAKKGPDQGKATPSPMSLRSAGNQPSVAPDTVSATKVRGNRGASPSLHQDGRDCSSRLSDIVRPDVSARIAARRPSPPIDAVCEVRIAEDRDSEHLAQPEAKGLSPTHCDGMSHNTHHARNPLTDFLHRLRATMTRRSGLSTSEPRGGPCSCVRPRVSGNIALRASDRDRSRYAYCSATYLVSRYSSMPSLPASRPRPDCLIPPNGAATSEMIPRFTPTIPASIASDTRSARCRSQV